ncbi:MAG: TRAP transporter small permease [Tropicimonas sp.]|uniref:TRAP transporter small permease n=1 Tax=Tropicimonas sp. TaxID=2067044 RepID=UPI003A8A0190
MLAGLNRLNGWLMHLCRAIAMLCICAIALSLTLAIAMRFFFSKPLVGSDDFALLALVWLTMSVAPLGVHLSQHVALEFLPEALPAQAAKWLRVAGYLVVLFVCVVIVFYTTAGNSSHPASSRSFRVSAGCPWDMAMWPCRSASA